ncbi:MAG: ABC transporter ATP-binding protein [Proteobacteria bacterium]|nr:ABC transporter ATP-binding protein [Pseudomonadota bacterium]HJP07477.1 ABC transporter ATP-binding protein [Arenicellales bacterium]|tara:strand:- start:808 stop:1704 length:897 start_codon:yes stop_codon:yes gene_type:complete
MTPLLNIRNLHVKIRQGAASVPILRGVSLSLAPGEVLGLVGESSAGKTMIGKATLGILPPQAVITDGEIFFDGENITHISVKARRRLLGTDIAMIPQDPMTSLNPVFRIGPQIADVLRLHLGFRAKEANQRVLELLDDVHINQPERVVKLYPHELSGGMRQRVLIAIAFACRPRLIIADEPTTALDVTVQRQVLRLIKELQSALGTAILFVTHDLGVVAKICNRVGVIHAGRILELSSAQNLFKAPAHPYTQALMAATPRYDRPNNALHPVPEALVKHLWDDVRRYDRGDFAKDKSHA